MKSLPLALFLALTQTACVGYPRVFMTGKKGTAALDNGKPIMIQAAIIKKCDTVTGDIEVTKKIKQTQTDDKGRYSLTVMGLNWNYRNFYTGAKCISRIQMFLCREICKPVDDVDIEVLGK